MSRLKEFFEGYSEFINSERYNELIKEEENKRKLIQRAFSKKTLRQASDEEFFEALKEALSSLWAIKSASKKEKKNLKRYIKEDIIQENGVGKLRINFYELIYGCEDLEDRFDNFLNNVDRLGVASVTEILCFIYPEKYAVWNSMVVSAIEKLGLLENLKNALGLQSARTEDEIVDINGRQYVKVIEFLNQIKEELNQIKEELENLADWEVDFLELNYFLYYVAVEADGKKLKRW